MRTDLGWIRQRLAAHAAREIDAGDCRRAAVAFVLRPADDDTEALFILRAEHPDDPWSGHMGLPGGRVDPTDPDPLAAVVREVDEEVAIDLERNATLVSPFDEVTTSARGRVHPLIITPFVFELTNAVQERPNEEVQQILWIRLSELLDPRATGTHCYTDTEQQVLLPCFNVAGQTIWGLTYHILTRLFAALGWKVGAGEGRVDPAYAASL